MCITLKAAWGDEHVSYTATLLHLIKRLRALDGVIVDASVESSETRALPKARRRLKIRERNLPLVLRQEKDLVDLRSAIQAAEAAVKVRQGTAGGNPTRRLELILEGRGPRWPRSGLQAELVRGHRFAARVVGDPSGSLVLAGAVPYRKERALPASRERKKFDSNPDLHARGAAAHAEAQNGVAGLLERYGLTAVSGRRGDAAFDIAWEWNGIWNLVEVKSLTRANEERQLRLGLGQVLRYRDLARADGLRSRGWLVTERAPTDAAWSRLCADVDVRLTWPTDFERRLIEEMQEAMSERGRKRKI